MKVCHLLLWISVVGFSLFASGDCESSVDEDDEHDYTDDGQIEVEDNAEQVVIKEKVYLELFLPFILLHSVIMQA